MYNIPVEALRIVRDQRQISQRALAKLSGTSYKSIQLVESKRHNSRISTLENIAKALGYPSKAITRRIEALFLSPVDSVVMASERIIQEGEQSWKIWLFNFVDAFRQTPKLSYIETPPDNKTPLKIKALLASTTEALCVAMEIEPPLWCQTIAALDEPWFVSGVENLKAMALLESPLCFRKRNIFVLKNFLERV